MTCHYLVVFLLLILPVHNFQWEMPSWKSKVLEDSATVENIELNSWYSHYVALHDRKLLVCTIDGNAPTLFLDLLCSLSKGHSLYTKVDENRINGLEEGCSMEKMEPHNQAIVSEYGLKYTLTDPQWTKVVWYREPLERFLYLYLRICHLGTKIAKETSCYEAFGNKTTSFSEAVQKLHQKAIKSDMFYPQSTYCRHSSFNATRYYDLIFPLTQPHPYHQSPHRKTNIPSTSYESHVEEEGGGKHFFPHASLKHKNEAQLENDITQVFQRIGIDVPHIEPGFRYHFPSSYPSSSSSSTTTSKLVSPRDRLSKSNSWRQDIEPMDPLRYYTNESVRVVLSHYKNDYLSFNISVPYWAFQLVGEDYVSSLSLPIPPIPRTHISSDILQKRMFNLKEQSSSSSSSSRFDSGQDQEVKVFDSYISNPIVSLAHTHDDDDDDDDTDGRKKVIPRNSYFPLVNEDERYKTRSESASTNVRDPSEAFFRSRRRDPSHDHITQVGNLNQNQINPKIAAAVKHRMNKENRKTRGGNGNLLEHHPSDISRETKLQKAINYRCHLATIHAKTPNAVRDERCSKVRYATNEMDFSHY